MVTVEYTVYYTFEAGLNTVPIFLTDAYYVGRIPQNTRKLTRWITLSNIVLRLSMFT
jgi:hypothetical protein